MRDFFKISLLGLLLLSGVPARANQQGENVNMIKMLRAQAVQSQVHGDQEGALNKFQQALSLARSEYGENAPYLAEIYYDMGSLCLNDSKFEKAEAYLKDALKLSPNSSEANLRLSELKLLQSHFVSDAMQKQRANEAAQHAAAVLAKHRNDVVAHRALAMAYETGDDSRRAYREYAAVDKLIQINRDIYDGKPVPTDIVLPSTTMPAAPAQPKLKLDDSAAKAQQQQAADAKKRAEQEQKALAEAKKLAEQEKREAAEAKKKADADKKNSAKKKSDEARKKSDEARKTAEAKKKSDAEKKKAAPPSAGENAAVVESTGLKANLRSKAVLLTPVKKKPAAVESVTPVIEPKKPAAVSKPEPAETAEEETEAPVLKKAAPAPKPKAEPPAKPFTPKPGKHAPGLVPPPPPMTYPVMPPPQAVAPPPPKPKAQPKKEEKPKEQAAAKEEKPEKAGGEDDDFLLDWGGAKNKKKK